MWDAFFGEGTYEETPGVEGLGGAFSGFSAEGVGGGVIGGYSMTELFYCFSV